jgi:hypothetical protein
MASDTLADCFILLYCSVTGLSQMVFLLHPSVLLPKIPIGKPTFLISRFTTTAMPKRKAIRLVQRQEALETIPCCNSRPPTILQEVWIRRGFPGWTSPWTRRLLLVRSALIHLPNASARNVVRYLPNRIVLKRCQQQNVNPMKKYGIRDNRSCKSSFTF